MASLNIECTSDKVVKTLKIGEETFISETIATETGTWCKCCLEAQLEQQHPDWMEDDTLYEAIENLDNLGDEIDVTSALATIEELIED